MASVSLAAVAIVTSLVGAGVSAYGQYQSGKAQSAIAQFNARQQEQQAKMSLLGMQAQAAQQRADAEANFKLRAAEAQARFNNADSIKNQAIGQEAIDRANLMRRRQQFERSAAEQRAAIAASGASEASGTPLDLLAETAAQIEIDQQDQHYANNNARSTLFREADMERLGGSLALAGATLNRNSALAEASLREGGARAQYLAGRAEAEITRLTGRAAQRAGNISAVGTVFSGIGSAADTGVRYKLS